jgi:DUF1365 family protein
MSFHQRDHGGGTRDGLRAWVEQHLAQAGLPPGGRIQVLCMPRVLGHAFNPISVYFCHAPDGALQAMLYEVNNTFGQRHSYLLPVHPGQGPLTQECAKEFHVSPFMDMDLRYRFRVLPPAARVGVFITASDQTGTMLTATFAGPRQCLTDAALARVALRVPFLGLQTVAGIHWEAAKLWFKGLKLRPATRQPAVAVTIGR